MRKYLKSKLKRWTFLLTLILDKSNEKVQAKANQIISNELLEHINSQVYLLIRFRNFGYFTYDRKSRILLITHR
jgi:hypothetical protein